MENTILFATGKTSKGNEVKLKYTRDNTFLHCGRQNLIELDVTNNPNLRDLYCFGNKFKKLDISKNTSLEYLDCSYSKQLEEILVSEGQEIISRGRFCDYDNGIVKDDHTSIIQIKK